MHISSSSVNTMYLWICMYLGNLHVICTFNEIIRNLRKIYISHLSKSIWFVLVYFRQRYISYNYAHKWSVVTKFGRQMFHSNLKVTTRSKVMGRDQQIFRANLFLAVFYVRETHFLDRLVFLHVYVCTCACCFFFFVYPFIHIKEIFIGNIGK